MTRLPTSLCVCLKLLQLCPSLCKPWTAVRQAPLFMGLQARILEWVAMPSSRGSSQPRNQTHVFYVSCIGRWILYHLSHQESPRPLLPSCNFVLICAKRRCWLHKTMKEGARNASLLASRVLNSSGCKGRQVGKVLYSGFQSCTNQNPFESDVCAC